MKHLAVAGNGILDGNEEGTMDNMELYWRSTKLEESLKGAPEYGLNLTHPHRLKFVKATRTVDNIMLSLTYDLGPVRVGQVQAVLGRPF